jgi:hypothetical protein
MYPPHPVCTRLSARHVKRGAGRIDADHLDPSCRKKARERPCSAADVKDGPSPKLFDQRGVNVKVGTIRIKRIVNLSQAPLFEDRISHKADRKDPNGNDAAQYRPHRATRGGS